eukprot:365580-Chlamydomonas_euryale.AAC.6
MAVPCMLWLYHACHAHPMHAMAAPCMPWLPHACHGCPMHGMAVPCMPCTSHTCHARSTQAMCHCALGMGKTGSLGARSCAVAWARCCMRVSTRAWKRAFCSMHA